MTRPRLLVLTLLLLHGCAYHRLVVPNPNPGDQYYHKVESTALGWGAVEERNVADRCETNILSEVRVRTTLGQALITVFTLGLVQPAEVQYRCSKLPTTEGTIPQ